MARERLTDGRQGCNPDRVMMALRRFRPVDLRLPLRGDVVRNITRHRSRELERYQRLSPSFGAQTVDLIAQVVSDTP